MDLKEYIKSLIHQQLEEESATGAIGVGAGPIMTPYAFSKGKGKNAATKYAEKEGWKVTKGETEMPGDSKVKDYVSLTGKKKKKVKIYKESDYDKASQYGAASGYTKASGYTGVGRDNHASTYYKESMDEFDATSMAKEYLGIEKYNSIFKLGKQAAERGETENPYARTHNILSRQAWDDGFNSIKKENMNESLINIIKEELLNEVTYHKFKNEVKFRTKNEQLHKAIREVKRKLQEIDRIVEYTSRMKQELSEGEEGLRYWKKTESNIATISEMVNHLNNKIKNLNQ
jgi:predicted transcriptional regulator